ncbi:hypothetical protein [Nocardia yamanashiensis]|uniref:hypothetical protein n=1 Tax=Nocardia yamanashiensis TaxID=209247 RepID=UPI000AB91341|nr:hypothetical protein [Nocardia yamanashiensis]
MSYSVRVATPPAVRVRPIVSPAHTALLLDGAVKVACGGALLSIAAGFFEVRHGLSTGLLTVAGAFFILIGVATAVLQARLVSDERGTVLVIALNSAIALAATMAVVQQWRGITIAGGVLFCVTIAAVTISSAIFAFARAAD